MTSEAVEAAKAELKSLEDEAESLRNEEAMLTARLAEIRKRRNDLASTHFNTGLISRARQKLDDAKREFADSKAPKFTVKREYGGPIHLVFVKRTPQRIYVRESGTSREFFVALDGTNSHGWKIDKEAFKAWAGL